MGRVSLGTDTSGRSLVLDDRTLAKLRLAEKRLGHKFTVVQGSWRGSSGAAASAGTHDRGGVVDLRTWDLPSGTTPTEAVKALRLAGLIAWYRTSAQGFDPHIHAIDYGNPDLAPSAARQVESWKAGRNGLASNGADDGPRVDIPKNPPKEPELNNVEQGRKDHAAGIASFKRAVAHYDKARLNGKPRTRVRVMATSLRALIRIAESALKNGPKS